MTNHLKFLYPPSDTARHRPEPAGIMMMLALLLVCCLWTAGCTNKQTGIVLTSYQQADQPKQYAQSFSQGWFCKTASGEYQIVLQNKQHVDQPARRSIEQFIFMTVFWVAQPGRTFAEASQLNARIEYLMLTSEPADAQQTGQQPITSSCYRGGGFVSFKLARGADSMVGKIESSQLEPLDFSSLAGGGDPLGRFTLVGNFKVSRDPGRVKQLENMLAYRCRD